MYEREFPLSQCTSALQKILFAEDDEADEDDGVPCWGDVCCWWWWAVDVEGGVWCCEYDVDGWGWKWAVVGANIVELDGCCCDCTCVGEGGDLDWLGEDFLLFGGATKLGGCFGGGARGGGGGDVVAKVETLLESRWFLLYGNDS